MTVRMVSATESAEELAHAVSEDWRKPLVPTDPEAPAADEAETQEAAPEAAEQSENEQPKKKGGFQKKIEKLTQLAKKLEDDLEAERKARRDVEARLAPRTETQQPTVDADAEPQLDKYATIQEYIKAMTKWQAAQTLKSYQAEAEKADAAEAEKSVFNAYNENVAKARAEHDDFDEVVGRNDIQIPQGVQLAILEMDNGPEVAYYLGQHPEVCSELVEMRPMSAIAKIGRIAATLEPAPSPEKKQRVEPPPPIRPVAGASARSSVPLDELKLSEFVKIRNQQERDKRRR